MGKIKSENYITIQGFMLTDLKLKGNELIIYACIYGFSQAEKQAYKGGLSYLAEWTNSTKQGVIKCLKSLEDKGFISKKENHINGVKFCEYAATEFNGIKQSLTGVLNKVDEGIKQSLPNNIDNNIFDNIDQESKKERRKKEIQSYNELLDDFGVFGIYREAIFNWIAHVKANGVTIINERLKKIIIHLDMQYADDDDKVKEIDDAIKCGYKRLPCE